MDRAELLRGQIELRPNDPFPRYALALELREQGALSEAIAELQKVVAEFPTYVPSYYHLGQLLEADGELDAAREIYEQGIQVASESGDAHALSELKGALSLIS
jgi:tetratricopeptide (TPR) repeat protein